MHVLFSTIPLESREQEGGFIVLFMVYKQSEGKD